MLVVMTFERNVVIALARSHTHEYAHVCAHHDETRMAFLISSLPSAGTVTGMMRAGYYRR